MAMWLLFLLCTVRFVMSQVLNVVEIPSEESLLSEKEVKTPTEGVGKNVSIVDDRSLRYHWKKVHWPTTGLPYDAVLGGADQPTGCGMVYVGRATYKGQLLPCKICGSDGRAFMEYNGKEVMLNESEILCSSDVLWKPLREGEVPSNPFQAGSTNDGEKLYIGRGFVGTLLTPGKVKGSSRRLYMTYNQNVYSTLQYEILLLG